MRLLIALPCLNEAETLASVIGDIPDNIPGIRQIAVLVIDDGSTDATRQVAEDAGAKVLSHGHNRGVGASFQTALRHAVEQHYDIMVNIDGDGQFNPADIPQIAEPVINDEADFVTASRFADPKLIPNMPKVKLWGNHRMSALISRVTGSEFHDVSCGFRAYSREAMLHLNLYSHFTYTQETFLDLTSKHMRIREVPVVVRYFEGRQSRVASSIPRYALKTAATIMRFYRDYRPLQFFWSISALFTVLGIGFFSILGVHYLRTAQMSGQIWAGFVGGFFTINGLVFFVLGMMADMLDRMRTNQERVLYFLKRSIPAPRLSDRERHTD